MADPNRIIETLKSKATLLIQREREVYALRLARERMIAWLRAFERLSIEASPETADSICAEWSAVMVQELHFQTAAAYQIDLPERQLSLIDGSSHAALPQRLSLDEGAERVLAARSEGVFEGQDDADLTSLGRSLALQRFLWFAFPEGPSRQLLLVAGVATGIAGAQAVSADDLINFTMLGRHLAVLLSNRALIGELGSARHELQELFDHMRQAIISFDRNGAVGGTSSQQAKVIFERADLEGCTARELLYPGAAPYDISAASFMEWVDMAFNTAPEQWPVCEAYAPREAVITDNTGREVPLELEFRPLVREGVIAQLMVLATDVSVQRELQQAVRTQEAQQARRMATMRRLIAGGTQVLLAFVESARARLDRCDAILRENASMLPTDAIDELFRQAHTVRGEARSFDLVELEEATTRLEEDLNELRSLARGSGHVLTGSCTGRLEAGIARSRAALDRGCEMLVAASPSGALVFDQVTVCRSVLRELSDVVSDGPPRLRRLVERLASVPLGVTAAGVVDSTPGWAALSGNSVALSVEPRELLVPQALARVLPGVLSHLVRNAIAHGIEPAAERVRAGKPEQGNVRISACELSGGVCIIVEDDGRGLDVRRILERSSAAAAHGDVAELVFLPGLSTREAPDALAGRGVGLDAVRSDLHAAGYEVWLDFAAGQWTRVTIGPKRVGATA